MRNYFYILFLFIGFSSCNDGDIIINNFEFENNNLSSCGKEEKAKVLFIINNANVFETISLQASNPSFSSLARVLTVDNTRVIGFDLSANNRLIYRTYNGSVPDTYFCSDIPPSTPQVNEEFISVGGKVVITTIRDLEGVTDRDGDSVLDVEELDEDTDGDGIMNILDNDDDGDNVLTKSETTTANDDPVVGRFRDTDDDDTPNYLDEDDDGDGVQTKFEVSENNLLPTDPGNYNDANLAHYLNPFIAVEYNGEIEMEPNELMVKFSSRIIIENLQLQNQDGSGEVISFESYDLGEFNSVLTPIIIEPTPATEEN